MNTKSDAPYREEVGAVLSDDRRYRYRLMRRVDRFDGHGILCFVMLNPSTADETNDDPTIRRCTGYARALACTRLEVVNLFAYRSTSPDVLYGMSRDMAVGPENDEHLIDAATSARIVVCAWGNHGTLFGRGAEVLALLRRAGVKPTALKMNGNGQPAHPLYLKADARPLEIA